MIRLTLLSFFLLHLCAGFDPLASQPRTITRLASSVASYPFDDDDLHFRQMITKARECAFSDTGSAVDAKWYLHEILHLESGCVSGNLSGAICENVDEVADIVAHLRAKVAAQATDVSVPNVALTIMSSTVLLMVAAILMTTVAIPGSDKTPFTLQEWMWAIQGGYVDNMIDHFMRNGGL